MTTVPRVATTMRSIRDPETDELRDSLSRDWDVFLERIGCHVLPIPNGLDEPERLVNELDPDLLLLTNGEDVGAHAPRDRTETSLFDFARGQGLPVLGVCRGHQFINHQYGGNLVNLNELSGPIGSHSGTEHEISVRDGPFKPPLPDKILVNSYHEWAVPEDGIADPLQGFAFTDSGRIVEGLYHPHEPVVSMQWHPERPLPDREPTDAFVAQFVNGELSW